MDLFAETDRLRFEFLTAELELSFTFARLACFELENGEQEQGQRLLDNAGKGCEVVSNLLADPKHFLHLSDDRRATRIKSLGICARKSLRRDGFADDDGLRERPASIGDLRQKNTKRGAAAEFAGRPDAPAELPDH